MNKKLFRAGNICFLSLFVATAPAVAAVTANMSDSVQSAIVEVGAITWINFGDSLQHVVQPDNSSMGMPPPQQGQQGGQQGQQGGQQGQQGDQQGQDQQGQQGDQQGHDKKDKPH